MTAPRGDGSLLQDAACVSRLPGLQHAPPATCHGLSHTQALTRRRTHAHTHKQTQHRQSLVSSCQRMVERQNQGRILFFGGGEGSPGVHHIVDDGGDKHTGGAVETFTCPLRFVAVLARGLQKKATKMQQNSCMFLTLVSVCTKEEKETRTHNPQRQQQLTTDNLPRDNREGTHTSQHEMWVVGLSWLKHCEQLYSSSGSGSTSMSST